MREETTEYDIVPPATGTQKQRKLHTGRYWHKGKYEDFKGEPVPESDSWDADYIRDVRMCLTGEESRCELAPQLFPLTSEEQKKYDFRLMWDATDFQPVRVFTSLPRRLPFVVRTVLGINVSGIGYDVEYKPQADETWFPTSYGTEYELHLFFHLHRTVSVSMDTFFDLIETTAK